MQGEKNFRDIALEKERKARRTDKEIRARALQRGKENRALDRTNVRVLDNVIDNNDDVSEEGEIHESDDEFYDAVEYKSEESEERTGGESKRHTGNESEEYELPEEPKGKAAKRHRSVDGASRVEALIEEDGKGRNRKSSPIAARSVTRPQPTAAAAPGRVPSQTSTVALESDARAARPVAGRRSTSTALAAAPVPATKSTAAATTNPVAAEPENRYTLSESQKRKSPSVVIKRTATGLELLSGDDKKTVEAKARSVTAKVDRKVNSTDTKTNALNTNTNALDAKGKSVAAKGEATAKSNQPNATTTEAEAKPIQKNIPKAKKANPKVAAAAGDEKGTKQPTPAAAPTTGSGPKQTKPASVKTRSDSVVTAAQEQQTTATVNTAESAPEPSHSSAVPNTDSEEPTPKVAAEANAKAAIVTGFEKLAKETNKPLPLGPPESMRQIAPTTGTKGAKKDRARSSSVASSPDPDVSSNADVNMDTSETTAQRRERMKEAQAKAASQSSDQELRDTGLTSPPRSRKRTLASSEADDTPLPPRAKKPKTSSRKDAEKKTTAQAPGSDSRDATVSGARARERVSAGSSLSDVRPSKRRNNSSSLSSARRGTNTRQRSSRYRDEETSDEETRRPSRNLDVAERRAQYTKTNSRAGADRRGGRDTSPLAPRSRDRVESGRVEKRSRDPSPIASRKILKNEDYMAMLQQAKEKEDEKAKLKELKRIAADYKANEEHEKKKKEETLKLAKAPELRYVSNTHK
jgi:hypothetical protein